MAQLRPWLDGRVPASQQPSRLLSVGRSDVEVCFLEESSPGMGRVEYPVGSGNPVVAPLAEGVFWVGAVCGATLGSDGRVAVVYPPLTIEEDVDRVLVGDAVVEEAARAEQLVETSELVEAHTARLDATDTLVSETKTRLDATDDIVDGLAVEVSRQTVDIQGAVQAADAADEKASQAINIANVSAAQLRYAFEPEPPADPVEGAVWFPRNEDGQVTGMWQWNGEVWGTHATLTGLLLVPTADGGQTLIGPDGVEATQVVADVLRSKVLYADVAGVETLVITDIPRQNLASDVGDALATAEELGSRIVLSGGKLTIARNRVNSSDPLTAMTLGATSLDFVVDDKPVAYIDSELEQMSVANVLARDSLHVGVHQWRTLPGTDVTVAQFVGAVS